MSDVARAEVRATVYRDLAVCFAFPEPGATVCWRGPAFGSRTRARADALGYELPEVVPLGLDDGPYETAYIALFEVGVGGAPCPLHSGHYAKDRMIAMEEVVRFYRFFGFEPGRSPDRYPDHLTAELEFMAHLADAEGAALRVGGDVDSPRLASRDFIARHLRSWLPDLTTSLERKGADPFFNHIARFAERFAAAEYDRLETVVPQHDRREYQHG